MEWEAPQDPQPWKISAELRKVHSNTLSWIQSLPGLSWIQYVFGGIAPHPTSPRPPPLSVANFRGATELRFRAISTLTNMLVVRTGEFAGLFSLFDRPETSWMPPRAEHLRTKRRRRTETTESFLLTKLRSRDLKQSDPEEPIWDSHSRRTSRVRKDLCWSIWGDPGLPKEPTESANLNPTSSSQKAGLLFYNIAS